MTQNSLKTHAVEDVEVVSDDEVVHHSFHPSHGARLQLEVLVVLVYNDLSWTQTYGISASRRASGMDICTVWTRV